MANNAQGFYDINMAVNDLKRQLETSQIEIEELRTRLESLRERNNKLSETNSLAPKRIALLEERLRDSKILLAKAAKENDKLTIVGGSLDGKMLDVSNEVRPFRIAEVDLAGQGELLGGAKKRDGGM